jgi:mutator protein MutT
MATTNKVTTLVFLRRGDEILLAMKKRGFGTGHWNGIGGKIDPGETVEEALVRESQEEISITPTAWEKVAEHDFHMDTDSDQPWHMFVHTYIADQWDGEPTESEEMAPKWYKISDIPYDSMWQDDPFWLPKVLDGNKVVGEYTFDKNNDMLTHDVVVVEELPGEIPVSM